MRNKKIKITITALAVISALLLAFFVLQTVYVIRGNDEYAKKEAADKAELASLVVENASLEEKLSAAVDETNELKAALEDRDKYFEENYAEELKELERKTEIYQKSADRLDLSLSREKSKKAIDICKLTELVDSLEDYIEKASPLVRVKLSDEELEALAKEGTSEKTVDHKWVDKGEYVKKGTEILGDSYREDMTLSELIAPTDAEAPRVAVYYEDLLTGHVYTYNADEVFDSASVMKAPYITAILSACTAYRDGKLEVSDDEEYSDEALGEMFDLDKAITLDHASMDQPGSGVLKDAEDGGEYTYKELIELSLKKSDNIAFSLVKKHFTSKWYYDFARENGAFSPLGNYMNMTAREAGKLFKAIYYFTLEDVEYGAFVRECMSDSAHTVLSVSALTGEVAHKYGWDVDAYHDAAVVYGDDPYIAIVFTDIDSGGSEADAYLRGIFDRIEAIHNFFK